MLSPYLPSFLACHHACCHHCTCHTLSWSLLLWLSLRCITNSCGGVVVLMGAGSTCAHHHAGGGGGGGGGGGVGCGGIGDGAGAPVVVVVINENKLGGWGTYLIPAHCCCHWWDLILPICRTSHVQHLCNTIVTIWDYSHSRTTKDNKRWHFVTICDVSYHSTILYNTPFYFYNLF